jgi:hypothetical protein
MPMPMMVVREVRVPVEQRLVVMLVGMRLFAVPAQLVRMSVVRIVHVQVGVSHRFVQMLVLVPFREMQPHADRHQSRCGPE